MVCPEGQIMFYQNVTQAPYCSACDTGDELIGTQCEGCQLNFFNDNPGGQCNQCPFIQTSNENNTGCQNREKEDLKIMYNENCVTSNAMTTAQCKEIIQLFNTYACN